MFSTSGGGDLDLSNITKSHDILVDTFCELSEDFNRTLGSSSSQDQRRLLMNLTADVLRSLKVTCQLYLEMIQSEEPATTTTNTTMNYIRTPSNIHTMNHTLMQCHKYLTILYKYYKVSDKSDNEYLQALSSSFLSSNNSVFVNDDDDNNGTVNNNFEKYNVIDDNEINLLFALDESELEAAEESLLCIAFGETSL